MTYGVFLFQILCACFILVIATQTTPLVFAETTEGIATDIPPSPEPNRAADTEYKTLLEQYEAERREFLFSLSKRKINDAWQKAELLSEWQNNQTKTITRINELADQLDESDPQYTTPPDKSIESEALSRMPEHKAWIEATKKYLRNEVNINELDIARLRMEISDAVAITKNSQNESKRTEKPSTVAAREAHLRRLHKHLIEQQKSQTPDIETFLRQEKKRLETAYPNPHKIPNNNVA